MDVVLSDSLLSSNNNFSTNDCQLTVLIIIRGVNVLFYEINDVRMKSFTGNDVRLHDIISQIT